MLLINCGLVAGVLSTLSLFFNSDVILDNYSIKVLQTSDFPIYSDQFFYLFFSARYGKYPVYSVLIFIIRDGVRVLEKGFFYPGFFNELEYPFYGKYLHVLVASVQTNNSISVRVQFNDISNLKQLEVRYGEFVSVEKMNYAKEHFLLHTTTMYLRGIHLFVRTKLTLNTLTKDGRLDGVIVQEPAYLVCRGSLGNPKRRVWLKPGYDHNVILEEYNDVINEHRIEVLFTLLNHRSQYECSTIDNRASSYVNVFHHPSKLRLEPNYYNTMPNGSTVRCLADDGYPDPKMQWYFIRGPINPDWYFNIYQGQLFLLPNAPIGSEWVFKCVAENVIPNSQTNSTSIFFNFTVVHSSYGRIILIGATASIVVIVFAVIIVLVVVFLPRKDPHVLILSPPEEPLHRKELAFDPDTAGSLKLSQSSECVHDEVPRYEDISNGDIDTCAPHAVDSVDRKFSPKEVNNNCYV